MVSMGASCLGAFSGDVCLLSLSVLSIERDVVVPCSELWPGSWNVGMA